MQNDPIHPSAFSKPCGPRPIRIIAHLLLFLALPAGFRGNARADLALVRESQSDYRIIIPAQAIPAERYAAEELQRYLERIGGVRLAILTEAEPGRAHEIILGKTSRPAGSLPAESWAKVGSDGFVLRSDGGRLLIGGGRPHGTLNGVYALLEEKLGVRWFTPEVEQVPKRREVTLAELNETVVPVLENRDVFWREMMRDADFAAKHRLNGQHYGLAEKHGGPFTKYYPFVHSFDLLIPRELYKEHPEYFPLINGERQDGYVQRCLSHPDVLQLARATVRQWIQQHPDATIISVSQNDTYHNCQCDACRAVDEAEGTPMGSLLKFVNAIASDIASDYPQVRFDTLAYQYSRKPPKTIRPHPNVIIRLCSIECCFAHPLETCSSEENRRFRNDIIAWQPIAPLLYVWDYTPNFGHYLQPFPNFDSLQANVRFFAQHGVKGLFEQGNYSSGGQGEMGPLRAYLLAKLLWNPETDVARHRSEFVAAYYGKAGDLIQAYLDLAQRQVRGQECHAHIFDKSTACYLNDDLLREGERLLSAAEQLADNDTVRARVEVAALPIWYVKIATNRVTDQARADLLRRFLAVARQAGISNISEGMSLDDWAKKNASK
ncbi:MAG: DUF4838 domain-containing protein [Verrucomicrobiota bacterium]